jgi:hypothetical protein
MTQRANECPQARNQSNVNPRSEVIDAFGKPFQGYASFAGRRRLDRRLPMKFNSKLVATVSQLAEGGDPWQWAPLLRRNRI